MDAPTKIKGVLFDNDGTLVDTEALILASMRHATKAVFGQALPDEELMLRVGQPLRVQFAYFTEDAEDRERLWEEYQAFNLERHDGAVRAFPGIREALEALRGAGLSLGIVTSKRHALCEHGLEVCGISGFFDCLIGTEDCETHKPEPGPVLAGAAALGLDPGECAFVGDSPYDIQAGNAAGAFTVAVSWGMFARDVLAACEPSAFCADPMDLLSLFDAV